MSGLALFVQFTLQPSGSPISGLMVVDALRDAGWKVHTVYHQSGDLLAPYEEKSVAVTQIKHGQWLGGGPWHRRARRLIHDLRAARRFDSLIQRARPNLVYVNNLTGLSAAVAARRARIPCIWHIRELFDDVGGEMHPPWPGGKRLVRYFIRRCADRVVVISRAVQKNVLGSCCADRTELIPNAADDRFFEESRSREEARQALGLPLDRPIVGVPGTLRPVKGHEFFLEALSGVVPRIPQVLAAITGDGEPRFRENLRRRVNTLGLDHNVVFMGTVPDMPAFYRACDLICIPSRSEPFGRTAIEAMAVGTPIVATRVGGLAETIDDGKTGLLVEYGNTQVLTERLYGLMIDPSLAFRTGDFARSSVGSLFSRDGYARRIIKALCDLEKTNDTHCSHVAAPTLS